MDFFAHRNSESGREQLLNDHLTNTAKAAGAFAAAFAANDAAFRCGKLHDLGKYSVAFQRILQGEEIRVDHSTAGAKEIFAIDKAAAFCIAGHHAGIPNRGDRGDDKSRGTLYARIKREQGQDIEDYSEYKREISIPSSEVPEHLISSAESAFFYVHMLFSCLVDADWLDTENFMTNGLVHRDIGEPLDVLSKRLNEKVSAWFDKKEEINKKRCEILKNLISSSSQQKGIFTLTVPTGGGKTVSSMAFALRHAIKNSQRRIIYVIPFTNIIEQSQQVFENILGQESIVAHYANVEYSVNENADMNTLGRKKYLATENWDAPIILTTAVQFFESLFGNRPGICRKLHNISNSVIIFDEAQMLPVNYLRPCVWAITELVKNYGCSAVLCTATQPSLNSIIKDYLPDAELIELCPNTEENYRFFKHVTYKYDGIQSDDAVAEKLRSEKHALCIVNSRKQAQEIFSKLPAIVDSPSKLL